MTSATLPPETRNQLSFGLRVLHLFTLCGFAFTEPVLTAFAQRTVYIHDQQFSWIEIGIVLAVLTILIPCSIVAIDFCVRQLSRGIRGFGRDTVVFVLIALILLALSRHYTSTRWLAETGFAGMMAIALSVLGSVFAVYLYKKSQWVRLWLTVASAGLLIFPGTFLAQFYSLQRAELKDSLIQQVKNPVPVVVVVFDEFSATTLLNDQMEIDAERFPQFARLAERSTFYRKATTVHPRTDTAVPAILSGRFPVNDAPPLAANYPGNLFQSIKTTNMFDMAVFEPVSRLCPQLDHSHKPVRSPLEKSVKLVHTLSVVYPRLLLAKDLPLDLPVIPFEWFGFDKTKDLQNNDWDQFTEGAFHYSGGTNRPQQLNHFLSCIKSSKRPRFVFLHAELPHPPWSFFASGEQYLVESNFLNSTAGAVGDLGEDWLNDPPTVLRNQYRYRQQVGYVDRFIGRLLDRMAETGIIDECLLIVTADHGTSFRPGHSRRIPDADNLPDILSVPLFIKLPGQTDGRIDDRNVESVDILPTIAEVLGIELQEPVDGLPVSQVQRRPRKTLHFNKTMTVTEPDFPQQKSAVLRQCGIFGDRSLDQLPEGVSTYPEWHGKSIADFAIDGPSIPALVFEPLVPYPNREDLKGVELSLNFIYGNISASDLVVKPSQLVVAVDDIIRDTGTTFWRSAGFQGFEFLLPRTIGVGKANSVKLYLIDTSQNPPRLKPIEVTRRNVNDK